MTEDESSDETGCSLNQMLILGVESLWIFKRLTYQIINLVSRWAA